MNLTPANWDSQFFGKSIARVTASAPSLAELRALVTQAVQSRIDCLYYLVDSARWDLVRDAQDAGFRVVDVRMTFEAETKSLVATREGTRLATRDDVPRLREIAGCSHRNTRFYTDGRLPLERCDEMYALWIQRSVEDSFADEVLLVEEGSNILGYISCSVDPEGVGSIGLCGVATEARGRKLGGRLVSAALAWMQQRAVERARVVTQANNVVAQRLYQHAGMRVTRAEVWLHAWPLASMSR